ncbi:hypothetical protein [Aquiflexum sp.]|uniref:hypothetical protein n=1 Tax=Aquiflexum sp. TaxID=1872584 RepID=UPI0035948743
MKIKEMILLHQNFLTDFGFNLEPKKLLYSKSFIQGKQIIFFHHTHFNDSTYFEYHLGVRFDQVESIIHKFLPTLGDYKDRSITLVNTMDSIDTNMPRRYFLENDLEANPVIQKVEDFMVKSGFPWMDNFSNGKKLEKFFNEDPDKNILTQNFTYRSSRGITLAKLYNPSTYKEVRDTYLAKMEEMQVTPFTVACFLNLLDYLDNL